MTKPKAHSRFRQRSERGAIVFVVAMTLAVLASLGLFALVAASGEVRTAGHERQNLQSHYLTESAVVAATFRLGQQGRDILNLMSKPGGVGRVGDFDWTQPRSQCWSLDAITPATVPAPDAHSMECKILNYRPTGPTTGTDLVASFVTANGLNATGFSTWPGPVLAPTVLDAAMRVEVTDPVVTAMMDGYAVPGSTGLGGSIMRPCTVTLTTYGETAPRNAAGTYEAAGLEVGRARVTFLAVQNDCQ